MKYIIKAQRAKQLRPHMFVFLSAKPHGPINESGYLTVAAALVEILHTYHIGS
jgi:geranylgeranyl pyrophosphate synthase